MDKQYCNNQNVNVLLLQLLLYFYSNTVESASAGTSSE